MELTKKTVLTTMKTDLLGEEIRVALECFNPLLKCRAYLWVKRFEWH